MRPSIDLPPTELSPETIVEAFTYVAETRRSVRKFDGQPVPPEVVRECLRLATLAPNSSNLQCWEFYWARDPKLKAALGPICLDQQAATSAGELIAIVARTKTWRRHAREMIAAWPGGNPPKIARDYYTKLAPIMYTQGPLNVVGMLKRIVFGVVGLFRAAPREPNSKSGMRIWAVKTTALAAENLMLAFRAHGYDTCPMEGFDSVRARKAFAIPRDGVITMILAVGKRAPGGIYQEQFRFPLDRFIIER